MEDLKSLFEEIVCIISEWNEINSYSVLKDIQ